MDELRIDPLQPSDDDASPSVFFDGVEDIKVLRATGPVKTINREREGTLDETVNKYVARHDFIRRQVQAEEENLSYKVSWVLKFFEDELDQWRRIARISKAKEDKEIKY